MHLFSWGALLPVATPQSPRGASRDLRPPRLCAVLCAFVLSLSTIFACLFFLTNPAPWQPSVDSVDAFDEGNNASTPVHGDFADLSSPHSHSHAAVPLAGSQLPSVVVPAPSSVVYQPTSRVASTMLREELVALDTDVRVEGSGVRGAYLTACVMIKDATPLMPEFIARNQLAGVDHFVFMDDSEAGSFEELHRVLEPASDVVTLLRVNRNDGAFERQRGWSSASQINSLLECAEAVRGGTTWIAFIDADEFFEASDAFANSTMFNLVEEPRTPFMKRFLMEAERNVSKPAVCVRWRSVLTNGMVTAPPCGVTLGSYFPQVCNVTGGDGHPLARRKAIVRASYLDTIGTPRDDSYGHVGYRFLHPFTSYQCMADPAPVEISIVHYWSMSVVDYLRKIARGRPRRSLEQRTMFDLLWREQICDRAVQDKSTSLRVSAVQDEIDRRGYRCEALSATAMEAMWTPADDKRFQTIVRNSGPAVEAMMGLLASGKQFNATTYATAFQLRMKKVYGGFLANIDLIPWIHYYLHGYDPETAPKWFSE